MPVINNSTVPISYREFDVVVPANNQITVQQPYNYIRILKSDVPESDLRFRFGSLSTETELSSGLGWGLDYTFASVTIRNLGNANATVRIAMAEGNISDDRLNISGTVDVINMPLTSATTSSEIFPAGGSIAIDSSSYKNVIIQNNSLTDSIFIFANGIFEVLPNGTFEKDLAASFNVYGTAGQKISVGLFK